MCLPQWQLRVDFLLWTSWLMVHLLQGTPSDARGHSANRFFVLLSTFWSGLDDVEGLSDILFGFIVWWVLLAASSSAEIEIAWSVELVFTSGWFFEDIVKFRANRTKELLWDKEREVGQSPSYIGTPALNCTHRTRSCSQALTTSHIQYISRQTKTE